MKTIIRRFGILGVLMGLVSCSSKGPEKVDVGDELQWKENVCAYVAPVSVMKKQMIEYEGESWPEKARVHSWETAVAGATAACKNAGHKVCRHVPARDQKEPTGKSGSGKYFYKVVVVGEKIQEESRSAEDIKRDQCFALSKCVEQKRTDRSDDLATYEQRYQDICR